MKPITYYSLNQYLKDTFGKKVYKIALDQGCTCPNRDGTLDTRGCIFCSKGGSGEFAGKRNLSIQEQINEGISKIQAKLPKHESVSFIAYFQAFTNTYGNIETLKRNYSEALLHPDCVAISIATRPDCLSDEILTYLKTLNQKKPVFVELGLQTTKESSIQYIRRGYPNSVYDEAVERLKTCNINVITHVILGLPGETVEDMLSTVLHVCQMESDGIKLQLLHVLKDTDLEKDYLEGKFKTLTLPEYIDILKQCISVLPNDMVVHRLTGDGDKKILVAPMWSADKKHVLNEIKKELIPR